MKIHRLVPSFDSRSTQARIYKAHDALGSRMRDVAMPESIYIRRNQGSPFKGALEGLNEPQFAKYGSDISVSKRGFIAENTYEDGVNYAKVALPVYCSLRKSYKGMLFVNLAHRGADTLSDYSSLEIDTHVLDCAMKVGDYYWVTTMIPSHSGLDCNPFDYAQAVLPATLQQAGGDEVIDTSSLCVFLREVFRFLNPEDRALYLEIMGQGKRFNKFLKFAASTRSHHNQEHGLLLHTAETVANVLLKALTVVDEYTQECLAIDVAGSIRSKRVIDVLSRLISVRGAPKYLRSDNGLEFVATKLLEWAVQEKLESVLIDPGKPWQNGTNESFNGEFRNECLSMEWFRNRLEARVIIEDWRQHCNAVRPHSSLNYLTSNEFVAGLKSDLPTETRKLSSQW